MSLVEAQFSIRLLSSIKHFKECEKLQQGIWGADPLEVVPAELMIIAQRHGGIALGAFDASGTMVGFLFGFLGLVSADNLAVSGRDRWQHCSHVLGVVPAWRRPGVAYHLKLAQRDRVMAQGIELVTWTFDPLEVGNAALNIGKIGAVCRCYLRDVYGTMPDKLNAGLPSDRFEVAWWVTGEHARDRIQHGWHPPVLRHLLNTSATILNPGRLCADGVVEPGAVGTANAQQILVEIPSHIGLIKEASMDLAIEWRMSVREIVESLFNTGYTLCDVVQEGTNSLLRTYYLMRLQ